jgi:DNA-binding FadR family transcriptional regulator
VIPEEKADLADLTDPAAGLGEDLFQGAPVERSRLYEEVLERLQTLIVSGRLQPGYRLPPERELMGRFGVGRPSVREAIFALQRRGMLSASAGVRPVVTEPTIEGIVSELSGAVKFYLSTEAGAREFQLARRLFEPALARTAARERSADDLARLGRALADNKAALAEPESFINTDVAFHFEIMRISSSQLVDAMHRAIFHWLREQRQKTIGGERSACEAFAAHERIYNTIAARDPDRAEVEMLAHLHQVEDFYWKVPRVRSEKS